MLVRDVLSKFAPMRKEPENPASPSILRWRAKQPILGRISLWVLGATPLVTIGSFFIPWHVSSGEGEMVPFIIGLGIGGLMCMVNAAIASVALARRENPRWPAITGLVLSLPPALGEVYLFLRCAMVMAGGTFCGNP